ncbi:hypothetical protein FB45DRAFT_706201, partial [Roridomyces roridus]
PTGFLFLCPPEDFRCGPSSFAWPERPWFWSLDPTGLNRLSPEEAASLGFPEIQTQTEIEALSWDTCVYQALRRFHAAQGFDPDSQELAIHLGHPLFRVM